jgi:hypothetical protein
MVLVNALRKLQYFPDSNIYRVSNKFADSMNDDERFREVFELLQPRKRTAGSCLLQPMR